MAIIDFPRFGQQPIESETVFAHVIRVAASALNQGARMWTALKNRRIAGRLAGWDDHMLHDIGLTRGDVHAALAGSLADDPTLRLVTLANERRAATRHRARRSMEI